MELHSRVPNFFLRKFLRFRSRKSPRSPTEKTTVQSEEILSHSQPLEDAFPKPENSFTIMPCRIHLQRDTVQVAAERLHQEAAVMQLVNDDSSSSSLARLWSPIGHYVPLVLPQCLPERLETATIILEMALINDDVVEKGSNVCSVKEDLRSATKPKTGGSSRRDIIQKIFSEKSLDIFETYGKEGQILVQKCHAGFLDIWAVASEKSPITFEDYLLLRVRDFGLPPLWAIAASSLGVVLTPEESKLIQPLVDIANRIIIQTNDYFSWAVERVRVDDKILNGILYLMKEYRISEDEAKERLKSSIMQDERTYLSMLDRFYKSHPSLPNHLQNYIAAVSLLVGGAHHWSATCPRYNPPAGPNGNQILESGITAEAVIDSLRSNDVKITDQHRSDLVSMVRSADEKADLDDTALLAPPRYIQSLASKKFRLKLIDAFNIWFHLPEDGVDSIKGVVNDLHNATLILDDIQDESVLRRGSSAAHCIFGPAQCINSATYMVVQATARIHGYCTVSQNHQMMTDFLEGLTNLSLCQSWDLNWKFNSYCPSTAEYMTMIDGKTGAMFKLVIRLMQSMIAQAGPAADFNRLTQVLGRWFQVRDDYQNLQDSTYTEQKGFCEDLDEGKLSYPVILCCSLDPSARSIILGIFRQKGNGTPLTHNVKVQILNLIRNSKALEKTWQVVQQLEKEVEDALSAIEEVMGEPNPSLRLAMKLLGDILPPSAV